MSVQIYSWSRYDNKRKISTVYTFVEFSASDDFQMTPKCHAVSLRKTEFLCMLHTRVGDY